MGHFPHVPKFKNSVYKKLRNFGKTVVCFICPLTKPIENDNKIWGSVVDLGR